MKRGICEDFFSALPGKTFFRTGEKKTDRQMGEIEKTFVLLRPECTRLTGGSKQVAFFCGTTQLSQVKECRDLN
jgi:hypothetical protein